MSATSDVNLPARPTASSAVPKRFSTAALPSKSPKINCEHLAKNSFFASGEVVEPTHDSLENFPTNCFGNASLHSASSASLSTSFADSVFAPRVFSSRSTVASSKAWSSANWTWPLGVLDVESSSQAAIRLRTGSTLTPQGPSKATEYRTAVPTRSTREDGIPLRKQCHPFRSPPTINVGCSKLVASRKSSHHRFDGAPPRNA